MPAAESSHLSVEIRYFEEHKVAWLSDHRNQYVVVRNARALGFYDSFSAAYFEGLERLGPDTEFLVKKVTEHEPVFVIY